MQHGVEKVAVVIKQFAHALMSPAYQTLQLGVHDLFPHVVGRQWVPVGIMMID